MTATRPSSPTNPDSRRTAIGMPCFGSLKLFHAQFNLEANGYVAHAELHSSIE